MIRINYRTKLTWLIFLLIFPNIKPSSISHIAPIIGRLYDLLSYLSFFIAVFLIIRKKSRIQPIFTLIILMEAWIFLVTFIHASEGMISNLTSFVSAITIPLIIYYFSSRMDELLSALLMNFEWMIYASLVSILLYYPHGMYISGTKVQYFLGNENGIIFYVIPALFLALIYIKKEGKLFRGFALIVACIANEVIVWCATGILGITVSGLLVFLCIKRQRQVNYYFILITSLIVDLLITVVRAFDQYGISVYIIQSLLRRSLTLSGRISIWDRALELIPKHLWTGMGRGDHVLIWDNVFHAHNEYFQLLLVGGLPLLALFLYLLFYLGKGLNRSNNNTYGSLMVMAMLTCLFVQFIATSRLTFRLYIPILLASYVNQVDAVIAQKQAERKVKTHILHFGLR